MSDGSESLPVLPASPFWPETDWMTSWQLARLALPGVPKQAAHINRRAIREEWPRAPNPFRAKARLYFVPGMPSEVQAELRTRFPEAFEGRSQPAESNDARSWVRFP
jgi:hypothetical protein